MTKLVLFFDGCHKIYYAAADDTATIEKMTGYGYDTIIPAKFNKTLRELWGQSCFLRFVQPADLDLAKPSVEQGQPGGLSGFPTKLRNYYKEDK